SSPRSGGRAPGQRNPPMMFKGRLDPLFTGTFLLFGASKPGGAVSDSLRARFAHLVEQNRVAFDTRRPPRHFGIRRVQPGHWHTAPVGLGSGSRRSSAGSSLHLGQYRQPLDSNSAPQWPQAMNQPTGPRRMGALTR